MANPPKGFWECPQCGGFVEDYKSTCSDCGFDKNKKQPSMAYPSDARQREITITKE